MPRELKITHREELVLAYIHNYRKLHMNMSPSAADIFSHLNTILPPRTKKERGKIVELPALVSTEQVQRSIQKLRVFGYLISPETHPEIAGKHRSYILTMAGLQYATKIERA
jgi:hypothetical protein